MHCFRRDENVNNRESDMRYDSYREDFYCNNIDSTKFFIQHCGFSLYTDSMKMKENLWFDNSNLIYPDSLGSTGINYLIEYKKGYFFIIKLQIARNHNWEEICKNNLYDTLVVTQEMLKQGNRIEYYGK